MLDHLDLDRATAQALVDARVSAVLNLSPFLSGRYPALGPALLAEAGILLVDRVEGAGRIGDGARVRVHDEVVYVDDEPVAMGREVDPDAARRRDGPRPQRARARSWRRFTHNSTEFLRREADLLLHGQGLPTLGTRHRRPPGGGRRRRPRPPRRAARRSAPSSRSGDPVLIGVDGGADVLLQRGPDSRTSS